jgi:hypothetical protein
MGPPGVKMGQYGESLAKMEKLKGVGERSDLLLDFCPEMSPPRRIIAYDV